MKLLFTSVLLMVSILSSLAQEEQDTSISVDNALYMEWVSVHGFRFISDFKEGEITLEHSEVVDGEGNTIPLDVNKNSFDISKYDFNQVIAPEKNTMIKISENKAVFVKSKHRQEVLFKRFLVNTSANN